MPSALRKGGSLWPWRWPLGGLVSLVVGTCVMPTGQLWWYLPAAGLGWLMLAWSGVREWLASKQSHPVMLEARLRQVLTELVLQPDVVAYEGFESFAVVGGSGLLLASAAVSGPVPDVVGGAGGGQDEGGEQAADFVAGQRDQLALARVGAPFAASAARVTARNAAAVMARVMWAYQAS